MRWQITLVMKMLNEKDFDIIDILLSEATREQLEIIAEKIKNHKLW